MDEVSFVDEVLGNKNIKHICFITNTKIQYFILSGVNDGSDTVIGYYPLGVFNPDFISSYNIINPKKEISFDCVEKGLHSNDLCIIEEEPNIEEATHTYHFDIFGCKSTYAITEIDFLLSTLTIDNLDLYTQYHIMLNRGLTKDKCKQLILDDLNKRITYDIKSVINIISLYLYLCGNCKVFNLPILSTLSKEVVHSNNKHNSEIVLPTLSKETMKYVKENKIKLGEHKQLIKTYETDDFTILLDKFNNDMVKEIIKCIKNL